MSGIFHSSGGYVDVPMLEGERIVHQTAATFLIGDTSMWPGKLVLTNQRLLFKPVSLKAISDILKEGIEFLPGNLAVLGKVVDKVLDYSTAYGDSKAGAVKTSTITGVRPGNNAALIHPPSLILAFGDGRSLAIGIVQALWCPHIWPGNNRARDEMVAAISSQLDAR